MLVSQRKDFTELLISISLFSLKPLVLIKNLGLTNKSKRNVAYLTSISNSKSEALFCIMYF